MVPTPNQILTAEQKIRILEEQVEEKDLIIHQLNDKIHRLSEQIEEAGCDVQHALALDFTVENIRAETVEKKLLKIQATLRANKVSLTVQRRVDEIAEGEE